MVVDTVKIISYIVNIIVLFLIGATLVSNEQHVSPFGSSFYGYINIAAILTIISGVSFLLSRKKINLNFQSSIVIYFLYVGYYFVQTKIVGEASINIWHYYHSTSFVLILILPLLIKLGSLSFLNMSKIVSFFVSVEVVICFLQYFNLIVPKWSLFEVYGSLPNPNSTALFLAISSPFVSYWIITSTGKSARYKPALLILLFISLVLLKSRTAIIGFALGQAYLIYYLPKVNQWIKEFQLRLNKIQKYSIVLFAIAMLPFLTYVFYNAEKGSSDGRIMIWKIGITKALNQPILGYGLNSFDKVYNLEQAHYFEQGIGTEQEHYSASYMVIALNDYIQNFVEGGIVGVVLFVLFFISLLYRKKKAVELPLEYSISYAGVLLFAVMGIFNTAEIAVPAFAILILYSSTIVHFKINESEKKLLTLGKRNSKFLALCVGIIGVIMLANGTQLTQVSRRLKRHPN